METKEVRTLVLKRVPPGDQWQDIDNKSAGTFPTLTDGLEYTFHKSGGKTTEFHLSSFKGEIYSVTEQDAPAPPKPRYSMYGEEVDEQPSMWNKE